MIVPVPETGKIYAQGLAAALGLPYKEGIYKSDRKRSFDIESFDERREFLFSRLNVVPGLLMGKSVIVVDEAIFTGATLKVVSHLLQQAGVVRVYFAIPSPEARYECKFNMQPKRNLLSEYVRKDDLWSYFNVQAVYFQDDVTFIQSIEQDGPQCVACFIQRGRND
jgi:amidophosphoribosyltransferase